MHFIAILLCVSVCQLDQQPTAESFVESQVEARNARIKFAEGYIDRAKAANDWPKLSEQAREALLKPGREHLAKVKADRQMRWKENWPTLAAVGEVFVMPSRKQSRDLYFVVESSIDKSTAIVFSPSLTELRGMKIERFAVLSGLTSKQTGQKKSEPLELSGAWVRLEDIKISGKTYINVAKWKHEAEAKQLWTKALKSQKEPTDK